MLYKPADMCVAADVDKTVSGVDSSESIGDCVSASEMQM